MELILDTCGLLSLSGLADRPLSDQTLQVLQSAHTVGVSACSAFEIAIKHKKGTLPLGRFRSTELFWREVVRTYHLEEVAVTSELFLASTRLPDFHADPFDRIIVASALRSGAGVVTYDRLISQYDVECLA